MTSLPQKLLLEAPAMLRKRLAIVCAAAIAAAAVFGAAAWYYLFREVPEYYDSIDEHFKYGSIGAEAENGIPYWVWAVLPRVFPDKLEGSAGYPSFGFIFEEGHSSPIGLPLKTIGFPRLGINCGLCHTGTYRESSNSPRKILIGAPNTAIDVQRYLRFLFDCASDPGFTADNILPAIGAIHDLSFIERLLYRYLIIPQTRDALLKQKKQLAWIFGQPAWGPGRQDPFNPAKVQILKRPYDGTIGAADIVPLWNLRAHREFGLHWDGLNNSLDEIFLNSAIGNGATSRTIDKGALERIQRWVLDLPPPAYPFAVDRQLAARGKPVFDRQCAGCHALDGDKTGTSIPIERIGTDRQRLDSWTEEAKSAFNGLDEYAWKYTHFRKTSGYVSVALDGIWARAPYLHNGSVPSLWDLLTSPDKRPQRFYRGYVVYDPKKVGFVSDGPEAERAGRLFETAPRGNSNEGHSFGLDLPEADRWALIEFLKTQ